MKSSVKKGLGFGLTSGIITTLGLIIGLYFSTKSVLAIIGGIITIAFADSFSDAMGMHISEESNKKTSKKQIWEATLSTLFFKFIFAVTFIIPFLALDMFTALIASVVWGLLIIGVFSYYISQAKKQNPVHAIFEHLSITIVVIVISYVAGEIVGRIFGQ